MRMVFRVKSLIEYLGGQIDRPIGGNRVLPIESNWWGVWWAILACVTMFFCGQSSKFIYIDF